jgi:hypothetical protein
VKADDDEEARGAGGGGGFTAGENEDNTDDDDDDEGPEVIISLPALSEVDAGEELRTDIVRLRPSGRGRQRLT